MKGRIVPIAACFTVLLLSAALAACQPEHRHTFSEEWAFDATHHWHEATCEHGEETEGKAEHTWNDGTVTTAATCTEGGVMTYTCTVCDATKQQTIPATGHTYAEGWTTTTTHHWHAATCEHTEEKKDYGEHTYNENKECTVCGYQYVSAGLEYTLSGDSTYYSVTGIGTCTDTVIYIPSTYNGQPVKEIGVRAFYENTTITGVVLPDSITTINAHAFFCCTNLASINLPEGLSSIGEGAFNSVSIASIVIPAGVTTISDWAFTGCENLTTVYYAGTQEGWNAISVGRQNEPLINATRYYYSETQPSTECYSWYYAEDGITPVAVEAHTIEEEWTADATHHWHAATCEHTEEKKDYAEHTYDENKVCTVCNMEYVSTGLEYTMSADGSHCVVSGIGTCTDTEIYIPATYQGIPVKGIGVRAFYENTTITGVVLPDSITTIGHEAFRGCGSLTSVTIGNNVASIGSGAFLDCSSLTSVTIPDSVTSIDASAFRNCSSLTGVTIPDSVTSIGSSAFEGCNNLASVTIGSNVTIIANSTFYGCSNLTSVTIGNGVTSIDVSAFYGCRSLTNITIPNTVTSISNYAFGYCSGLTSVIIPDTVTSIGDSAFYGCSNLASVTIGNGVTSIANEVFRDCSSLTSVTIPNSVTGIGNYAFCGCSSLTSVIIPNSVTSIGRLAFSGCSGLISVTIGSGVTSIEMRAFLDCSSLESVTIGSGVTGIGRYAFEDCNNLTSVTFANPYGWSAYASTSSTNISSSDLENTSTAATYLTSTYFDCYWRRTA